MRVYIIKKNGRVIQNALEDVAVVKLSAEDRANIATMPGDHEMYAWFSGELYADGWVLAKLEELKRRREGDQDGD